MKKLLLNYEFGTDGGTAAPAADTNGEGAVPASLPAAEPAAPRPARVKITSLEQFDAIVRAPFVVPVPWGGQTCGVEVRALTPRESAAVSAILKRALPPIIKDESGKGEDRYDFEDATYKASAAQERRRARALALHTGVPMFRAAFPGPMNEDALVEAINGTLTEKILEELFEAVAGGPTAQEFTNFFSEPG